jgi:transcriptional regulator with XRE-family HTH domain
MSSGSRSLGAALRFYRWQRGKSQAELARDARISDSALSEYETGETLPPLDLQDRILAALEVSTPALERAVLLAEGDGVFDGIPGQRFATEAAASAADSTLAISSLVRDRLLRSPSRQPSSPYELLERLTRHPREARRAVLQEIEDFRIPDFCALLCAESERLAPRHLDSTLELADLAVLLAELADVEEHRRPWLLWYAWAFLGNARRATGDLINADLAFIQARRALASAEGHPAPLDGSRPFDLEASLRRDQRRFLESLALLAQALSLAATGISRGRILIKRAKTLEEIGDTEGAITALRQADACLGPESEPRLRLCVVFNLPVILCDAGRADEAEQLLPRVEELTEQLANRLDLVRLRWLKGKIAAGRGRTDEAITLLREVRDAFVAENIAYDAGLVTLELAVVYAEQGRTAEVRTLARESAPVFAEQRVERELFATMKLFRQAAERETLTAALARRLLDSLKRGEEPA